MTKQEEHYFIDLFLNHYNKSNNTNFGVITRPESDQRVNGTYDYLCCDKDSTIASLAIELTGLHKSQSNVKINKNLDKLIHKFLQIIRNENLKPTKRLLFQVKFKNFPKTEETKFSYAAEMARLVKQSLIQHELRNNSMPFRIPTKGLPFIDEFSLYTLNEGEPNIIISWIALDNESSDILPDVFTSLIHTLDDNNPKLGIPKNENKKTILLIVNSWILVDEYAILTAYKKLPPEKYSNMDEIFFINQNSFSEDYDILKIK